MIFKELKNFCVIDTETTGLSKFRHITEFAAVKFRDGIPVDKCDILINPGIHIDFATVRINQIDDELVKDAPTIREASSAIYDFIEDDILVAHNAIFDVTGLNNRLLQGLNNRFVDTLEIFKETLDIPSYKLSNISKYLDISVEQTHRALDDVEMTINCLKKIEVPYSINIHTSLTPVGNYRCSDIKPTMKICNTLFESHCVITGTIDGISRLEIQRAIVNHGGTIGSSVVKKTRYLITCDKGLGGTKLSKAKMKLRNGDCIEIIDFHCFNKQFCLDLE